MRTLVLVAEGLAAWTAGSFLLVGALAAFIALERRRVRRRISARGAGPALPDPHPGGGAR